MITAMRVLYLVIYLYLFLAMIGGILSEDYWRAFNAGFWFFNLTLYAFADKKEKTFLRAILPGGGFWAMYKSVYPKKETAGASKS